MVPLLLSAFLRLPPIKKHWNLGTLEPTMKKLNEIKHLHGSNFFDFLELCPMDLK